MEHRSCTILLIGSQTANREWINYEIIESWKKGMGIAGVYIHGLKDLDGYTSDRGDNPFRYIEFKDGKKLSSIIRCYDPKGLNSNDKYSWISDHLSAIVEEAISIRK